MENMRAFSVSQVKKLAYCWFETILVWLCAICAELLIIHQRRRWHFPKVEWSNSKLKHFFMRLGFNILVAISLQEVMLHSVIAIWRNYALERILRREVEVRKFIFDSLLLISFKQFSHVTTWRRWQRNAGLLCVKMASIRWVFQLGRVWSSHLS